jgi:hypothetical protein
MHIILAFLYLSVGIFTTCAGLAFTQTIFNGPDSEVTTFDKINFGVGIGAFIFLMASLFLLGAQ